MRETAYIPLDDIRVATPCRASWEKMSGDDRSRFCQTCQKNVYNLSAMSEAEATALILEKEGSLCVRFYQREDGTVLTGDCPVGLHAVQRRLFGGITAGFAACVAFAFSLIGIGNSKTTLGQPLSQLHTRIMSLVRPTPEPVIMGAIAVPNLPPPTKSPQSVNPSPPVNCPTDKTKAKA